MQDIMPTWVGATAKQIARGVRRGDVSATQVLADHLDHVAKADADLAAFRAVRGGEAVTEAEKVDEQEDLANLPLAGVPVAVKENTAVAGMPTWNGSAAVRTPVAEADHEVVRRLRGAGAVILGVTRMPELGLWAVTDDDTAVTRNPWDLGRTPGGSSGGAAAAVAAGLVPIAHGNDGLGSIRIPAACCGLVGLKPGRGVVPCQLGAEDWFGLVEHGMLTTTVADAAVGFQVLAGRAQEKLVPPQRLRVGVSLRSPVRGVSPDAPNREAVAAAGRLLAGAGHDTVPADPVYPTALGLQGIATWFAAAAADVRAAGIDRGSLQPRSRRHVAFGELGMARAGTSGRPTGSPGASGRSASSPTTRWTCCSPRHWPPRRRRPTSWSSRSWRANMLANIRYAPYAAPWNIAGLPALVVPVGRRPDGLPLAVQLVGPPGSELLLLGVAGQFEMAAPWPRHAPGYPRGGTGSPAGT